MSDDEQRNDSVEGGAPEAVEPEARAEEAPEPERQDDDQVTPEAERRRQRATELRGAREIRRFDAHDIELRETSDGMLRFSGYASVTEHPYEVADFTETVARGAFRRTLNEEPDVVFLVNHGEGGGLPLARTKSGTMSLTEDARGLRVDADLNPADPDVARLVPKLQRGDVSQMSFAFRATDQEWSDDYSKRLLRSVAMHQGDVSIVTMAANPAASGGLATIRSTDGSVELRAGKTLSSANENALRQVLDLIAAADEAVDGAQPMLADVIGVPNPDDEDEQGDSGDGGASDEGAVMSDPSASRSLLWALPDHTTVARQKLLILQNGRRR